MEEKKSQGPWPEEEEEAQRAGPGSCDSGPLSVPYNAGPDERPGHVVFRNNLRPGKHRSVAGSREFHMPGHESGTQELRSDSEPQPEEDDPGMVHGEPEPRRPANSDSQDPSGGNGGLRDSLQSRYLGEALGP